MTITVEYRQPLLLLLLLLRIEERPSISGTSLTEQGGPAFGITYFFTVGKGGVARAKGVGEKEKESILSLVFVRFNSEQVVGLAGPLATNAKKYNMKFNNIYYK